MFQTEKQRFQWSLKERSIVDTSVPIGKREIEYYEAQVGTFKVEMGSWPALTDEKAQDVVMGVATNPCDESWGEWFRSGHSSYSRFQKGTFVGKSRHVRLELYLARYGEEQFPGRPQEDGKIGYGEDYFTWKRLLEVEMKKHGDNMSEVIDASPDWDSGIFDTIYWDLRTHDLDTRPPYGPDAKPFIVYTNTRIYYSGFDSIYGNHEVLSKSRNRYFHREVVPSEVRFHETYCNE